MNSNAHSEFVSPPQPLSRRRRVAAHITEFAFGVAPALAMVSVLLVVLGN